jgi:hypothetical protein
MMEISPDTVAAMVKAKRAVTDGRTALWNMRLEALVQSGSLRDALDFAGRAVEDTINNCGCNVQCGAALAERGAAVRGLR